MPDRWGEEGPPPEAYSRVTRDLAALTAGFARYLDELPGELTARYLCRVRSLSEDERLRLRGSGSGVDDGWVDDGWAVEPSDADSATLLVGRTTFEGGASALLGFGVAAHGLVPDCFCDACDEDSESLVARAEELVRAAVHGCVEFRRPYQPRRPGRLFGGPWLEEGFTTAGGGFAHASAAIRGEPFSRHWQPWTPRSTADRR